MFVTVADYKGGRARRPWPRLAIIEDSYIMGRGELLWRWVLTVRQTLPP